MGYSKELNKRIRVGAIKSPLLSFLGVNMKTRLALKTLEEIDRNIENDQGNKYRYWLQQVLPHVSDAYRQDDEEEHRGHLGASIIGNDCARAVYYSYRWFSIGRHNARIIRLFNRGHIEEARMIAYLLSIGVNIYQQGPDGKQFRISHVDGHFGGSGDGVGIKIPDLQPDQPALLEFKTHNDKSFNDLEDKGVRESKLTHYVQMQIYMRKMGLHYGLYLAVNKNTDHLYAEIITLNTEFADRYLDLASKIIYSQQPPVRISMSPGFWKCRFCAHRMVCHQLDNAMPATNCRTCVNSMPSTSGEWICSLFNKLLSKDDQVKGCIRHHPIV